MAESRATTASCPDGARRIRRRAATSCPRFCVDSRAPNEVRRERARAVLDWLVSIQLDGGGFQGGVIGQTPVVPVTFNTGTDSDRSRERRSGARRRVSRADAAALPTGWSSTQDVDGAWRSHPTPFAKAGEKAYETHVAWGLLEAAREEPARGYAEAALRNIRVGAHEAAREWLVRGLLPERCVAPAHAHDRLRAAWDHRGLIASRRTTRCSTLPCSPRRARCPRFARTDFCRGDSTRTGPAPCAGRVSPARRRSRTAGCSCIRSPATTTFIDAARRTNAYLRARVRVEGDPEVRGGVKGSFPVDGEYGKFEYLSWACKFFIDANLLERELSSSAGGAGA